MKDGKYMPILAMYVDSVLQDLESFLRTEVDLVKDDVRLVLDEYNSSSITYELEIGIYFSKDFSKALKRILQPEYDGYYDVIGIENDEITMKTKLFVGEGILFIKFDELPFFSTVLGFTPGWDYKPCIVHMSQIIVNLGNTNKIHLKCDVIDGSIVNGLRQPILFSFGLDKKPGYKLFCEPETLHYKKINESILITITFYLKDNKDESVDFNGGTLTFTLQMIKI